MDRKALHRWVMVSAIGAVCIFVVSVAASVLLKPDYHIFMNFLSNLGTGEASGPLFSAGMVATAALLVIYFSALRPILGPRQRVLFGSASGIAAAVGLACVGIFPAGTEPYHSFSAAIFFLASGLAVVLFHLVIVEERISTPVSRASGVAYVALGVLFVLLERPWVENLSVMAFGIWLLAMVEVSGRTLTRRSPTGPPVSREPGAR